MDSHRNEGTAGSGEVGRVEMPDGLDRVATALRGLRYGVVTAVVQDGVIVQIERTEKIRLTRRSAAGVTA